MWDIVVVGLGGVGGFALRAVTQILKQQKKLSFKSTSSSGISSYIQNKPMKILGIEKYVPCHEFGSSHGKSRIYRHAYFEDPKYVPLIQRSTMEFDKLQHATDIKLLEECGMLMIEDADSQINGDDTTTNFSLIEKCLESANMHNIPVKHLSSSQLVDRYPQFNYFCEMNGLFEPKAGFVRPELSIGAALTQAKDGGAVLWKDTSVDSLHEVYGDGDVYVELTLSNGRKIQSRKVIVAAGAWTTNLIPSWAHLLKVTRQIQAWIDVGNTDGGELYSPNHMPTWLLSTKRMEMPFYGIPADPTASNPTHMKIALHGRDIETDPDLKNPPVTKEEKAELQHAFELFFTEGKSLSMVNLKSCMYTMTPDEHFLLGRPEGYNNIYAAAGLSGHGFKMVPSLGQALAEMALNSETELDVSFLSPSRFGT